MQVGRPTMAKVGKRLKSDMTAAGFVKHALYQWVLFLPT
jgi:hypothetical protein